MDYLFVYGTLRPGLASPPLAQLMARFRHLGPATLSGTLHDLGPYPAAVPDAASQFRVRGELYGVPADRAILALLDHYEGYFADRPAQSLFRRVRASVTRDDGQSVHAWVYVWNRPVGTAPVIPGGDYRAHKGPPAETSGP
jgi:gamma-glutamylcyclotransferase (GGCT)/AIG2-like uncharacterized protein YtfP